MAGYTYPPELWTISLTGAELVPLWAGSVYATSISLTTLAAFVQRTGATLSTADPHVLGEFWNNGGFVCVSAG